MRGMADADFTLTLVPSGAVGEDGAPLVYSDDELAHVRDIVSGMLKQLVEGPLPLGFALRIESDTAESQHTLSEGELLGFDPTEPPEVEAPPDRFAQVEEAECSTCGGRLARQSPALPWYHLQECPDPRPRKPQPQPETACPDRQ